MPLSSQGIIFGHVEKPWEAKPRHTGKSRKKGGTNVHWEQNCHHQPWCPSSSEPRWVTAAATKSLQAPSYPSWRVSQGWGCRMHR